MAEPGIEPGTSYHQSNSGHQTTRLPGVNPMCTVLLPPGVNPTAINPLTPELISYHASLPDEIFYWKFAS
jgi:hypothetical protein